MYTKYVCQQSETALPCSYVLWEAPRQSEALKEQTHGRGLGMFTLWEKSRGGQQRPKSVRAASAPASTASVWAFGWGKIHLSPFSLLPEKGEAVKQMTRLNRWSQWGMRSFGKCPISRAAWLYINKETYKYKWNNHSSSFLCWMLVLCWIPVAFSCWRCKRMRVD